MVELMLRCSSCDEVRYVSIIWCHPEPWGQIGRTFSYTLSTSAIIVCSPLEPAGCGRMSSAI